MLDDVGGWCFDFLGVIEDWRD